MKKLTFIFALLCASVMGWAGTKYCNYEMTAGGHTVYFSAYKVSEGNYQIKLTSTDAMDALSAGCYMNVNGVGGYQMLPHSTVSNDKKTITVDIAGTPGTIYNPLYIMMPGEVAFTAVQNVDIDWENTCEGGGDPEPGTGGGEEPDPDPNSYTAGGHTIHLDASYVDIDGTNKTYTLVISSTDNMDGLAGSFWNVNGVGADMRTNSGTSSYTVSGDKKTITCQVQSSSAPNIYTPLYVLMPGEVNFGSVTLNWENRTPIASEYCAQAMSSGNTLAKFTWETTPEGNIDITIIEALDGAPSATYFRGNGITAEKIKIGDGREDITTYFTHPGNINGQQTLTLTLTDPANAPAPGTKIYVTEKVIEYATSKEGNAWPTLSFEYTYGGVCADESVLTDISLTASASFAKVGENITLTAQPLDQMGVPMAGDVDFAISPADAGTIVGDVFTFTKVGAVTITASVDAIEKSITLYGTPSANLALNQPCEAGYENGNSAESKDKANDGNDGTNWNTYADKPSSVEWWYVDLGEIYNLTNIAILWGDVYSTNYVLQTRIETPSVADKADDAAWVTLATVTDATANAEKFTNVSGVGRYVRIHSLAKSSNFFRMREFRVYASGVAEVDTEAPVMSSASLVSNTDVQAVIAVAATDNVGIARYHVVDAGNSFNGNFVAEEGRITVTGLTGGTSYNFTITAIDFFGNESANSKSVAVTTTAHYTEPQAACAAPTWPANQVKAMYSPNYEADCGFDAWGSGTVYTQETYGKKYVLNNNGYFGLVGFSLNCLMMEKLHFDIWIADDATIRFVPIWGGAEQGITKSLTGQQWNSIDIDLSEYTSVTDWGNVYQMKIDQASNLTFWIANAYFYRESAIVDSEVPTNVSAILTETGFYSVKITAQAKDNSGAVNFRVMNGETILATGAAATGVATTITVNNLTPGTNYNFNVVAYDEAGNAASPVVVEANTKVVPAPIVPDFNAKVVLPVFTDAKACVVNNIHSGGWGETTQHEWLQIAPNDKVFYAQNFNYAGWHSWGGGDINASEMDFLHVDIYSTGMTQVSVTPISPGHEGSYTIELTPNAWTSADIPLSAYDASNIDWTKIFQFKFMGAVGGNELMIDNVYFWSYGVTTTSVMGGDDATGGWATFACAEKIQLPDGISAYKAIYSNEGNDEVLNLTELSDGIIPANAGVILHGTAGETFTFSLTNATPVTDMNDNMLVGCAVRTDISGVAASHDIFCMRYSELFGITGFFLYTGQYIPAGKAYLPVPKDPGTAPASRRVRFVFNNENVATGVEQEANMPTAVCQKVIENGRLIIIRNGIRYTAEGLRVE